MLCVLTRLSFLLALVAAFAACTMSATPEGTAMPTISTTLPPALPSTTPTPPEPTHFTVPGTPTSTPESEQAVLSTPDDPGAWRGITIEPEHRCSPYDADEYRYPQSVEPRIVAAMGGIVYGPYTGTWFESRYETDIEHIVARSEAHDSGLCAASAATKRRFSSDLLNLTLASPAVNRSQKGGKDAAEWLPGLNRCWFADRVVEVRRRYGLTIDRRERDVLESILSGCTSTAMIVERIGATGTTTPVPSSGGVAGSDVLRLYDDNGNGRITCAEARAHGIAPVHREHPAYRYMHDGDGDGVVCE